MPSSPGAQQLRCACCQAAFPPESWADSGPLPLPTSSKVGLPDLCLLSEPVASAGANCPQAGSWRHEDSMEDCLSSLVLLPVGSLTGSPLDTCIVSTGLSLSSRIPSASHQLLRRAVALEAAAHQPGVPQMQLQPVRPQLARLFRHVTPDPGLVLRISPWSSWCQAQPLSPTAECHLPGRMPLLTQGTATPGAGSH